MKFFIILKFFSLNAFLIEDMQRLRNECMKSTEINENPNQALFLVRLSYMSRSNMAGMNFYDIQRECDGVLQLFLYKERFRKISLIESKNTHFLSLEKVRRPE